jgi:hypothetical protein
MFAEHGHGHLVGEVVKVPGDEVGHLAIFGVSPGMIDWLFIMPVLPENLNLLPFLT